MTQEPLIRRISQETFRSFLVSLWFMFLTFPLMVIRVNTTQRLVEWRWKNMVLVGLGSFVLSFFWRSLMDWKEKGSKSSGSADSLGVNWIQKIMATPKVIYPIMGLVAVFALVYPLIFSTYQINVMSTALIYVVLGLGLNIVVGLAGLLDLGYVAFYAVGAYSYALLNHHFALGFWTLLPLGGLLGAIFGVLLGFPVLRLRGDYLAIVTLGFGEIIRLVLENWNAFSFGPSGVRGIDRPGFFGMTLTLEQSTLYMYYLMIGMTIITIFVTNRLKNSRIGRAWLALREDEIACQAMGIDKMKTKLLAFALGATWAGFVGVLFAAKTAFINPASFTFLESAIVLAIVVLGGMGSIIGVILAALILVLMPEYLRAFKDYRMLIFGATMVLMMVFRPQGLIANVRKTYQYKAAKGQAQGGE